LVRTAGLEPTLLFKEADFKSERWLITSTLRHISPCIAKEMRRSEQAGFRGFLMALQIGIQIANADAPRQLARPLNATTLPTVH
jgi:hypothetical protein